MHSLPLYKEFKFMGTQDIINNRNDYRSKRIDRIKEREKAKYEQKRSAKHENKKEVCENGHQYNLPEWQDF